MAMNEIAGVGAPMVAVPLGTYTGWNMRRRDFGHGALYRFEGSYTPFPESVSERRITGDPRSAIVERYSDRDAHLAANARAAALTEARLILEEDIVRCTAAAAHWGHRRHATHLV